MALDFDQTLAAAQREVAQLRRKLVELTSARDEAKARKSRAEGETRRAREKLVAFDEEEKKLRAAFLENPFWDQSQVHGSAARLDLPPKR